MKGLSRMRGNSHVRFLGEGLAVMPSSYPITQKVWGSTQENDIASLRVYMASLRKKLERYPDAPHLIQTHVGVGYRMLRAENDEA